MHFTIHVDCGLCMLGIGFHWLDENIQNHEKSFMFTTQKQPGFPQNFHFNSIKAMSIHVTLFSHLKQLFLV